MHKQRKRPGALPRPSSAFARTSRLVRYGYGRLAWQSTARSAYDDTTFFTLPALRQDVQTLMRRGTPLTYARTR